MTMPTQYRVTIDYSNSFKQMVETGRYDWRDRDINQRNFLVTGEGVVKVNLELVHLNKVVNTPEVRAYLVANGLRAATIEKLLALGARYPGIQKKFLVVALGSSWWNPRDGHCYAPCLGGHGPSDYLPLGRRDFLWRDSVRELHLGCRDDDWRESCRFLAVRSVQE